MPLWDTGVGIPTDTSSQREANAQNQRDVEAQLRLAARRHRNNPDAVTARLYAAATPEERAVLSLSERAAVRGMGENSEPRTRTAENTRTPRRSGATRAARAPRQSATAVAHTHTHTASQSGRSQKQKTH
jgi:hypothetical protein